MELIRKVLLAIEDRYTSVGLYNIKVEGYDFETVAYHCKVLHNAGLISEYNPHNVDQGLIRFEVGSLTWEGHEFLDRIRDDTVWGKTKDTMKDQGIPFGLDAVKQISSAIVGVMIQSAIKRLTP